MTVRNIAASVRAKLLNRARDSKQDFNLVLTRYTLERLLYRMSISPYQEAFLLKGALLFDLWFDIPHRPTRDADFLGFGSAELSRIHAVFEEICNIHVDDGILFQSDTVNVSEIRKESNYAGVRVMLLGTLDSARCHVQVDIGFGDAVTPSPEMVVYPAILPDFEPPQLRVYPRYTVVAEKFHTMTSLGIANSRMKDYFDLWVLSQHAEFDGETLKQAIKATFERRKTPLPEYVPFGLTEEFTKDTQKQIQWSAFIKKNNIIAGALHDTAQTLSTFLMPATICAFKQIEFGSHWSVGGPWEKAS